MSTFAFGDFTVTTWAMRDGKQVWRARRGDLTAEFFAPRDTDVDVLYHLGRAALGAAHECQC